jgi:hypothetical protein
MSGTEATFVIGLISGVISIIEATKTIYNAAKDAKGQPEAFRQVAVRLPLVSKILHSAKKKIQTLDETEQEALEPILKSCKAKAANLEEIFQKVVRKDDDKWYDRYRKAVATVTKGSKVESLIGEILKDVQVIACEKLEGTATSAEVKEMKEMPSSLQDETGGGNLTSYGSGHNILTSGGNTNINSGSGEFYHNVISGGATFGGKN